MTNPAHVRSGSALSSARTEFLSPEHMLQQEFDLTYQDYETGEDEESDSEDFGTGRTAEIFGIAEPLNDHFNHMQLRPLAANDGIDETEYAAARQISIFGNVEAEMDSDEEADIMREIKAEITAQVRNEMQDELAVYKKAREKLNSPREKQHKHDDNMDPELREAIVKMKKLDKILNKKIKREKEVKRDRILLQRRLKEELENLKPEGRDESEKVKTNTERFLSLALPLRHNADAELEGDEERNESQWLALEYNANSRPSTGVTFDEEAVDEENESYTPLFQTQVMEETLTKRSNQTSQSSNNDRQGSTARSASSQNSFDSQSIHTEATSSSAGSKGSKKKKNFIERNIKLSSDAGNAIAMTEDEKERINDLLKDLDSLPDIPEEGDRSQDENPYQIAIPLGEGYMPTPEQMSRLEDIDSRLKMLLPPEDYESIASNTPRKIASHQFQMDLFSRTGILDGMSDLSSHAIQVINPRETALLEAKEQRDLQGRLREIEDELSSLSSVVESEIESPSLSSHQLQDLLDECSRTMTRVTEETSTMSRSTQRSDDSGETQLSNIAPLPKDVLQKLLAEARQELRGEPSPRLSENEGTFITKDDLVLESISEETLRDLLKGSRTTSRTGSRPSSRTRDHSFEPTGTSEPRYNGERGNDTSVYARSSGDIRRQPFLPEIDPRGQLSTQKLNEGFPFENGVQNIDGMNHAGSRPGSSNKNVNYRNGDFTDVQEDINEGSPTPHPPTSGRRTSSGGPGRPRTVSPLIKTMSE